MPVCPLAYFSITSLVKAIQLECRVGCELDINSKILFYLNKIDDFKIR